MHIGILLFFTFDLFLSTTYIIAAVSSFSLTSDVTTSIYFFSFTFSILAIPFSSSYSIVPFQNFVPQKWLLFPVPVSVRPTLHISLTMTIFSLSICPCWKLWGKRSPSILLTFISTASRRGQFLMTKSRATALIHAKFVNVITKEL